MNSSAPILSLVLAMACNGSTADPPVGDPDADADLDGDGYTVADGDCDDSDAARHPEDASPVFELRPCQAGTVFLENDDPTAWTLVDRMGDSTSVSVSTAGGCRGDALALSYTLDASTGEGTWLALRQEFSPRDLSDMDFLTVPFRGEGVDEPDFAVEIKLEDSTGCRTTVRLDDATDLPTWRPAILALAEFTDPGLGSQGGAACTVDQSSVAAVELAISDAEGNGSGTLYVDDLMVRSLDEVRGAPRDYLVCPPTGHDDVLDAVASSLADKQAESLADHGHDFVPSWYPEEPTVYYMYDQGLVLLVFALEAERTGAARWQDAADRLAAQMLERLDDAAIWSDGYVDGDGLESRSSSDPWCGNIAWPAIGLTLYLQLAPPADPQLQQDVAAAIGRAGDWLVAEIAAFADSNPDYAGSITWGTEGGVSTYFALQAAHKTDPSGGYGEAAEALAQALLTHNWSSEEERFYMGIGDPHMTIDVMGNWGARFLFHRGMAEQAHAGLALSAGVFPVLSWDEAVMGMGDIAGPWQPSTEFSAQYSAIGGPGGAVVLEELLPLGEDGAYPGATDDFNGGQGWNTSWQGVSASTWIYIALSGGVLQRI